MEIIDSQESFNEGVIKSSNTEFNDKKEIYILILIPNKEKIDFQKLQFESKISKKIFFSKNVEKEDGTYLTEIVFKFVVKKEKDKKNEKYTINFSEGDNEYIISFIMENKSFIYSPELKKKKNLDIEEPIEQNIIPLYNKFNIILEALEKNDENFKEEKLFEDTIDIYEKEKKFSLLITLFLKIYLNYKDLCNKLIEIFFNVNDKENIDREQYLKKDLIIFHDIYSKAQDIITENIYNPIYFYGILFCYFNYYDKDNFDNMIDKFSEENDIILYEILIQYYIHFMNPLNQNKEFYNRFIKYIIKNDKDIKIFKRALDYIEDIETFLFVINDNKEKIFKKYDKLKSSPIKIGAGLKLIKYKLNKTKRIDNYDESESECDNYDKSESECDIIIKLIEEIIKFSEKEKMLAIYIKSTFWINLIKKYDIPDWKNIDNLYKLRLIFKKYKLLINFLFENTDNVINHIKYKRKKLDIKIDINCYYERDEFAILLNKNIKNLIEKNKLTNSEILGIEVQFDPYFSIRDLDDKERYKNKRETYIFDYINFSKITPLFILNFQKMNFEIIFEENINDYINKITGKIKDIHTFDNVIELININRLKKENQKDYFKILKEKYELIIEKDIKLIKEEVELKEVIRIIAGFVSKIFLYEKNNNFLDDKIGKLENEIKALIYIELINNYNNEEYKGQKDHIYNIYLNNIETNEGRDNIIKLMKILSSNEKKIFIEKLLKKCVFTKEEFFSDEENFKIKILCEMKKELDLLILEEQGNESAKHLINTLDEIRTYLDEKTILKKDLENFFKLKRIKKLKIDKEGKNEDKENETKKNQIEVIEKLGLISFIIPPYNPILKYSEYKRNIKAVNEKLGELIFIRDSLMIYHKNIYNEDIKKITNIINKIENGPIKYLRNEETRNIIERLEHYYKPLCYVINKVKYFLFFKKIYENIQGKDQLERFENALKKLNDLKGNFDRIASNIELIFEDKNYANIFKDIKEELGKKDESESDLFIDQMIQYFNIKKMSVIEDLTILIKSKKYEIIVKSIKYFFDNFTNEKLNLPNNLNLSQLKLKELKSILNELKCNNIFDYKSNIPYYKVFTSFYEKSEVIDFLKKYININEKVLGLNLKNNLQPTNRIMSTKDIDDTIKCLTHFKKFKNKNNSEIIEYIKSLSVKEIEPFENFSKKYTFIIELDNETGENI